MPGPTLDARHADYLWTSAADPPGGYSTATAASVVDRASCDPPAFGALGLVAKRPGGPSGARLDGSACPTGSTRPLQLRAAAPIPWRAGRGGVTTTSPVPQNVSASSYGGRVRHAGRAGMRNYTDVRVQRAALHVVAPKAGRLRLTETPLDLDNGVGKFLAEHVVGALADERAKSAKFIVMGDDRASGLCRRILASGTQFVEHSGLLAGLLYAASEGDDRVSDGSLVVLRCRSAEERFIAMLKLDPSNQYRTVEDEDAQGRPRNRMELETGILPSARERLLKTALVRSVGADDYDMLLLDRQRAGEVVSRFFIQDFLGAEPALDARTRTTTLYKALTNVKNEVAAQLEPVERERLEVYIKGQVAGDHINVDELVAGLPVGAEVRQRFDEEIAATLPDREFDVDPETAASLLKSRRFAGDNGLRVSVPDEFFRDMVDPQPPGEDGLWTVTIRTRKWRET